ncbi:MAG: Flp pilus assembly complex ATPase component TadA [Candidatus Marinimicrobia bacterium]|nr:Flp pilus assembly complex ATPase component TadA [Candidatus Neomarinimicrobiota bacterium]MCF7922050.1 Flp pilus assembly complex ATPase component TadA [Candidatus Neomarinimicrobiota bacterium]
MFNPQFQKLGDILIHENVITQEQLDQALERQSTTKEKLGKLLIRMGMITEADLVKVYALQLGHPAVYEEDLMKVAGTIVNTIPEDFAYENMSIVLGKSESTVVVAMEDPEDLATVDSIEKLTGLKVEVVVAGETALQAAIEYHYGRIRQTDEVDAALSNIQVFSGDEDDSDMVDLSKEGVNEEDAPFVKLVNLILMEAIKERSTDVHVEPQSHVVNVRIRIDGVLQKIMTPPISSLSGITTRIKILSNLDIAERRLPQDGRMSIQMGEREIDVRVSVLPTVHGEKIVMRLLDKGGFNLDLTTLGFHTRELNMFGRWIRQPYGLVVISGPTGSGKSTTLYASLKEIKSEGTNITTVEDPVEYQMDGISQVQMREKIGLTFGSTLRSILRQDPDILLIGEIRDEETADIAIKFALTGHLVFSTVHANDAPSTITRLIDIGVPPFLVGSSLNLVMAQRLVRTICSNCKEEYTPTKEELTRLGMEDAPSQKYYHGRGCVQCRQTGYRGRSGIFEMLEMRQAIRKLVFENANQEVIREKAIEQGMVSLREAGIRKLKDGITTFEEVLRSTVEDF